MISVGMLDVVSQWRGPATQRRPPGPSRFDRPGAVIGVSVVAVVALVVAVIVVIVALGGDGSPAPGLRVVSSPLQVIGLALIAVGLVLLPFRRRTRTWGDTWPFGKGAARRRDLRAQMTDDPSVRTADDADVHRQARADTDATWDLVMLSGVVLQDAALTVMDDGGWTWWLISALVVMFLVLTPRTVARGVRAARFLAQSRELDGTRVADAAR